MPDPFNPPPQQPQDPRQTPYGGAYAQGAQYGTHRSGWFWVAITVGIIGVVAIAISLMMASMVKTLGMDASGGSMDFSGGDRKSVV